MQQSLIEAVFVTGATWAVDAAVDHWIFAHQHSVYHVASFVTAVSVGAMCLLWRHRERQYHREMHAFKLRRRARQHTLANKLNVISLRAGGDPQIEAATREISKLIEEPMLTHCTNEQDCVCAFMQRLRATPRQASTTQGSPSAAVSCSD
jgi:hypothetical protein